MGTWHAKAMPLAKVTREGTPQKDTTSYAMPDQPIPYRRLRAILKTFGIVEDAKRGKGSERMFVGVVGGKIVRLPTKCHNEGDEKPYQVVKSIRRHFKLTKLDGVSDRDFYKRA